MPVIVDSKEIHPFLPTLGSVNAIERERAERQDIRPLEIAIVNLMADKQTTERQLATWLGNTILQVHLTFVATDNYVKSVLSGEHKTTNTPSEHICKFYNAWSDIKHRKFDGVIITGVNALEKRVEDETIWPEVQKILDWSAANCFSALFLCWGAKAALKHFYDINSYKGEKKLSGLFEHELVSDKTGIAFGFPDKFLAPVSRWKNPLTSDVKKCEKLELVADSSESGPNIIVEPASYADGLYPLRVFVLCHPEYDTDTLKAEYLRDKGVDSNTAVPRNYFPGGDPNSKPHNSWRHTALVYSNWVKLVYGATPFDLNAVPKPFGAG